MLIVAFVQWWYGPGWKDAASRIVRRIRHAYLDFSVPILLRTLFSPWRRITTDANGAVGQQLRAIIDNTVSRFVGLTVRLIALLLALLMIIGTSVFGGLLLIIWPLAPALGLLLIIGGVAL